jgi:Plasma-membrane choline transporter
LKIDSGRRFLRSDQGSHQVPFATAADVMQTLIEYLAYKTNFVKNPNMNSNHGHSMPVATTVGITGGGSSKKNPQYATIPTATVLTATAEQHHDDEHYSSRNAFHESSGIEVYPSSPSDEFVRGQVQVPAFHDKWFAVAFLTQLSLVVTTAILFATGVLKTVDIDNDNDSDPPTRRMWKRALQSAYDDDSMSSSTSDTDDAIDAMDVYRFLSGFLVSLVLAPVLAILAVGYMHRNAVQLIKFSLYLPIALNLLLVILYLVLFLSSDDSVLALEIVIFPLVVALLLIWYARTVWPRIPFAAANVKAAITCVRSNFGMAVLGLSKIPIYLTWLVVWGYAFGCVLDSPMMQSQGGSETYGTQEENEDGNVLGVLVIIGLLLSFFWTWQVIRNIVHCSLAGTVGTWWFLPQEASSCCSSGLTDSLSRSLTYSLGSICFGSLLVAIIDFLKYYVRRLARDRRALLLYCIAQCLLRLIDRIAQYFNKWAFVYVGVYGYSYMEAGQNVWTLFGNRGWSTIISDLLVNRMLGLMSLCVGFTTALVAAMMTLGAHSSVVFFEALYAFIAGMFMAGFVFSVLVSANESIIVLFCEAPGEFATNHPALSREMVETWMQTFPDVFSSSETNAEAVARREIV